MFKVSNIERIKGRHCIQLLYLSSLSNMNSEKYSFCDESTTSLPFILFVFKNVVQKNPQKL